MDKAPLEKANYILIAMGIGLFIGGGVILYRTGMGVIRLKKADPKANLHLFSNGLNVLIGLVFMGAGVLFVMNNLRGNPLALP